MKALIVSFIVIGTGLAHAINVPHLRSRMGVYPLILNAGSLIENQPLNAAGTFIPTVLWDWPSFRSRIGLHFLVDLDSDYGLVPISGMGLSGYFYIFGISSSYEIGGDETIFQRSKAGPFVFATLTPVNLSIDRIDETALTNSEISFSALVYETHIGFGFDYPLRRNTILSLEIGYRFGEATDNSKEDNQTISYSGIGGALVFATSYY